MNGREEPRDVAVVAARVLVGREVHWTLVLCCLVVLATFLPVAPLRALGDALHGTLGGLSGVTYWAALAVALYAVSLVVGGIVRALGQRFGGREPSVTPSRRPARRRLPSPVALKSTVATLAGPEVVGSFVVVAAAGWLLTGRPTAALDLVGLVVASYVLAVGLGNLLYLLRR